MLANCSASESRVPKALCDEHEDEAELDDELRACCVSLANCSAVHA